MVCHKTKLLYSATVHCSHHSHTSYNSTPLFGLLFHLAQTIVHFTFVWTMQRIIPFTTAHLCPNCRADPSAHHTLNILSMGENNDIPNQLLSEFHSDVSYFPYRTRRIHGNLVWSDLTSGRRAVLAISRSFCLRCCYWLSCHFIKHNQYRYYNTVPIIQPKQGQRIAK
jgi:hypothetical protein